MGARSRLGSLAVLLALAGTACLPSAGPGIERCRPVDLPRFDSESRLTVVSDDGGPACAHRLVLEVAESTGDETGAAARALEEDGWLLDRHDGGTWTGWVDQGHQRYRTRITAPDDRDRIIEIGVEPSGPAAAAPIDLELRDLVPVDSPRIVGHTVVLPTMDGLHAFSTRTGAPTWSTAECAFASWLSPVPGPEGAPLLLRCDVDAAAVDADDGTIVWRRPLPEEPDRVRESRTMVVLQSQEALRVLDMADGTLRWVHHRYGDAAVAVDDERVYVGNDLKLWALDGELGVAEWQVLGEVGALLATDDDVYLRSSPTYPVGPDSARLVRLDPATGERRWSIAYHERFDASQVVDATDKVVVLANEDHVGVYDTYTGEELWWEYTQGQLSVTAGAEHVVITDSMDGRVVAYDAIAHRQERLLGTSCGLTAGAAGLTAVQVSCEDPASVAVLVFDLHDPN